MSNWKSLLSQRRIQLALAVILLIALLIGLWTVRARFIQRVGEFVPSLRPTPVVARQVEQAPPAFFLPYITSNPAPLVSAPLTSNSTPTPPASAPSTTEIGELLNIPLTPLTLVLIALAGIVLVGLLPLAAVPLLIVATVLDRFRFDVASLGLRIEHVALLAVAVAWTINLLRRRERFRFAWDDALLALYWFIALVASFLNAPSFKESAKFLGLMGLAFLTYWFVKTLVKDEKNFRRAFVVWLSVGVGEALFGIIGWLAMPLGINLGVQFYPYGPNPGYDIACRNFTYSPYGTLFESNIFGSYTMGISLILLTLWLSAQFKPARKYLVGGVLPAVIAVALSLTRGALAGFGLGALAILLLAEGKWKERIQVTVLALVFLGVVVFGVTALSERLVRSPLSPVSFRLSEECVKLNRPSPIVIVEGLQETPTPAPTPRRTPGASPGPTPTPAPVASGGALALQRLLATESVGYRLDSYVRAVNDWLAHPWIGNGANVFAQKYITTSQTPDWISNVELMSLHDTGIIGTSVLLLLFIALGRDLMRAVKNSAPGFTRAALVAMALSFIGLLVAYQVTTAFWLGFTWVQLGLMRAATLILRDKPSGIAEPNPIASNHTPGSSISFPKSSLTRLLDITRKIIVAFRAIVYKYYGYSIPAIVGLGLIVVLQVIYARGLNNQFLSDDWFFLHTVSNAKTLFDLFPILSFSIGWFVRPTQWVLTFGLYSLFGLDPAPYHLTSLMFDLANVGLVLILTFQLLRLIGQSKTRSVALGALASLLFLYTWRHHEAILWYSSINELLSAFFRLIALNAVLFWLRANTKFWLLGLVAILATLLALASKESSLVLPVETFLLVGFASVVAPPLRARWKQAIALVATQTIMAGGWAISYLTTSSTTDAGITRGGVYIIAARAWEWPLRFLEFLNGHFPGGKTSFPDATLLWIELFVLILFVALALFRKRYFWLFALMWTLVAIAPYAAVTYGDTRGMDSVLVLGVQFDRFLYYSSAGAALLLVASLLWIHDELTLLRRARWVKFAFYTASAVFILALLALNTTQILRAEGEWITAATISNNIRAQLVQQLPQLNSGDTLCLGGLPDNYQGRWIFHNNAAESIFLLYDRDDFQVQAITATPDPTTQSNCTSVFIYNNSLGLLERTK